MSQISHKRVGHRLLRDRLLTEPLAFSHTARPVELEWVRNSLLALRNDAVVVEATNVSNYYFEGTDVETWYPLEDFPNVAPPFPVMWIEHHAPERIVSREHGVTLWGRERPLLWGVLCVSSLLPEDQGGRVTRYASKLGIGLRMPDGSAAPEEVTGVKWVTVMHCYMAFREGSGVVLPPPAVMGIAYVGADGALRELVPGTRMAALDVLPPTYIMRSMFEKFQGDAEAWSEHVTDYIGKCRTFLYTTLLTLSFMHCRNVIYSDVPPTPLERDLAKKRKQPDPITYKVLELTPFRPKHQSLKVGEPHPTGHKSLHIVRGNFATYDEKPLFGKFTGTFWRPMHASGSLSAGLALKDYKVDPRGKK